uniref:RAP domain-containing protein n=1 Tax=Toxoplasma gondii COUG TaxID=1074873 RepID=A0A2G8XSJ7_TOXGO|nr:hypothetical protein TGCOUG_254135 [Toxoplasma gondii COUG]
MKTTKRGKEEIPREETREIRRRSQPLQVADGSHQFDEKNACRFLTSRGKERCSTLKGLGALPDVRRHSSSLRFSTGGESHPSGFSRCTYSITFPGQLTVAGRMQPAPGQPTEARRIFLPDLETAQTKRLETAVRQTPSSLFTFLPRVSCVAHPSAERVPRDETVTFSRVSSCRLQLCRKSSRKSFSKPVSKQLSICFLHLASVPQKPSIENLKKARRTTTMQPPHAFPSSRFLSNSCLSSSLSPFPSSPSRIFYPSSLSLSPPASASFPAASLSSSFPSSSAIQARTCAGVTGGRLTVSVDPQDGVRRSLLPPGNCLRSLSSLAACDCVPLRGAPTALTRLLERRRKRRNLPFLGSCPSVSRQAPGVEARGDPPEFLSPLAFSSSSSCCGGRHSKLPSSAPALLVTSPRFFSSASSVEGRPLHVSSPLPLDMSSSVSDLLRVHTEAFLLLPPLVVLPRLATACAEEPNTQRWPVTTCRKVEAYLSSFLASFRVCSRRPRPSHSNAASSTSSSCLPSVSFPASSGSSSTSSSSPSTASSSSFSSSHPPLDLLSPAVVITHFLVVHRRYLVGAEVLQGLSTLMHAALFSRVPRRILQPSASLPLSSLSSSFVCSLSPAVPGSMLSGVSGHAPSRFAATSPVSASLSSSDALKSSLAASSPSPAFAISLECRKSGGFVSPPSFTGTLVGQAEAAPGGDTVVVEAPRQTAGETRLWLTERAACAFLLLSVHLNSLFPRAAKGAFSIQEKLLDRQDSCGDAEQSAARETESKEARELRERQGDDAWASASPPLSPFALPEGLLALERLLGVLNRDLPLIAACGGGMHWESLARGLTRRRRQGERTRKERNSERAEGADASARDCRVASRFPAVASLRHEAAPVPVRLSLLLSLLLCRLPASAFLAAPSRAHVSAVLATSSWPAHASEALPCSSSSSTWPSSPHCPVDTEDKEGAGPKSTAPKIRVSSTELRDACVEKAVRLLDRSLGWSRLSVSPTLGPAGVQLLQQVSLLLPRCISTSLFSSFRASSGSSSLVSFAKVRFVGSPATEKNHEQVVSPLSLLSPSSRSLLETVLRLTLPRTAAMKRRLSSRRALEAEAEEAARQGGGTRQGALSPETDASGPGACTRPERVASSRSRPEFSLSKLLKSQKEPQDPHASRSSTNGSSAVAEDAHACEGRSLAECGAFSRDEGDARDGSAEASHCGDPPNEKPNRSFSDRFEGCPRQSSVEERHHRKHSDLLLLDAIEREDAGSFAPGGVKHMVVDALRASTSRVVPTIAPACNLLVPLTVAGTSVAVECVEPGDVFVNAPDVPTLSTQLRHDCLSILGYHVVFVSFRDIAGAECLITPSASSSEGRVGDAPGKTETPNVVNAENQRQHALLGLLRHRLAAAFIRGTVLEPDLLLRRSSWIPLLARVSPELLREARMHAREKEQKTNQNISSSSLAF